MLYGKYCEGLDIEPPIVNCFCAFTSRSRPDSRHQPNPWPVPRSPPWHHGHQTCFMTYFSSKKNRLPVSSCTRELPPVHRSSHPLVPLIFRKHRLEHSSSTSANKTQGTHIPQISPSAPFRTSTPSPERHRKTPCRALRGVVYDAYKTSAHIHAARLHARTSRATSDARTKPKQTKRVRLARRPTVRLPPPRD